MAGKKSTKSNTTGSGGNNINIGGSVKGGNIVVGNNNRVTQTTGMSGDEIVKLFETVYTRIEKRKDDPAVDKEEITQTVQRIEEETAKGEEANPGKVDRWLKTLNDMAPDIGEVVISCLTSPAAGIATVIRKIGEKAKAESQK
jgi:hypothetical protein